ncbi:MAG: type II toxin-antitoxin system prevent-host-death family antitoxin [Planctomycetota bacterium]
MTFTEARANLGSLIDRVASDNDVVVISRKNSADVALISAAELSSLQETAHLFSSPANAKRLMSALKRAKTKKIKPCSVDSLRHEMGV